MMRKDGARESGRASIALIAAFIGLAAGLALGGYGERASGQTSYESGNASTDLRAALASSGAARAEFGASGAARFSRPLEVPPLYAFDAPLDETNRQIILVDSETKRICVYWVRNRGANSTIELVATRAFELDLKLENFNGEGLTPSQIREQLESGQR